MVKKNILYPPEFANLTEKVNNNCLPVDYFRKNLFNATIKDSYELKRKKIVYDDGVTIIKADRSLNQRHRDLLSIIMIDNEFKKVMKDGAIVIRTKLYRLAKKMYPNSKNAKHRIKELFNDMRKTLIYIKQNNREFSHTLLGNYFYDIENDDYAIVIPSETSKYIIYTVGVSIPKHINDEIVKIKNAQLKALISYMLSNRKFKYGIHFDTICEKLDIKNTAKSRAKSKFKKTVRDNINLLRDKFGILFKNDKLYSEEQLVEFYHALSDKELKTYEQKQIEKAKPQIINAKIEVLMTNALGQQERIDCIICDVKPFNQEMTIWQPIAQEANNPNITYQLTPGTKEELEHKFKPAINQ